MNYIDFHSHILPELDHGSRSVSTSIEQLNLAKKANVGTILSTSHFYPHMHDAKSFLMKRTKSYEKLMNAIDGEDLPKIVLAAEVLVCEGIQKMPNIDLLCIENTKSILLELPSNTTVNDNFLDTFYELSTDGYDIILAHADRYDPRDIEKIVSLGAKIQLNAPSLSGLITKRHVKNWIDRNLVVAIGSDIHGADAAAYKHFSRAMAKLKDNASAIMKSSYDIIYKTNI